MFRALEIKWTERELALHYSPNWYRVYRAALLPRSKWLEADRLWARAYKLEQPPLLPGARRILRLLAPKFDLGIVTSGNRARVRRQLREFSLADYFSACVCSEDTPKKKPHPAPLQLALKRLRLAPGILCTLATRPRTSKWLAVQVCAPSAYSAHFQRRRGFAQPNRKSCSIPSASCRAISRLCGDINAATEKSCPPQQPASPALRALPPGRRHWRRCSI